MPLNELFERSCVDVGKQWTAEQSLEESRRDGATNLYRSRLEYGQRGTA